MAQYIFMVTMDAEQVPGAFDTIDDAQARLQKILESRIGHYNPTVAVIGHAPLPKPEKTVVVSEDEDEHYMFASLDVDYNDARFRVEPLKPYVRVNPTPFFFKKNRNLD